MDMMIYILDKFGLLDPAIAFVTVIAVIAILTRVMKRS